MLNASGALTLSLTGCPVVLVTPSRPSLILVSPDCTSICCVSSEMESTVAVTLASLSQTVSPGVILPGPSGSPVSLSALGCQTSPLSCSRAADNARRLCSIVSLFLSLRSCVAAWRISFCNSAASRTTLSRASWMMVRSSALNRLSRLSSSVFCCSAFSFSCSASVEMLRALFFSAVISAISVSSSWVPPASIS